MHESFIKVATAIPAVKVGNCTHNAQQIIALANQANDAGAAVILFPELCVTSYTCGDLFIKNDFLDNAECALNTIIDQTKNLGSILIVGMPVRHLNSLFNCAVVIGQGRIFGVVPKQFLPSYNEFYELRWFTAANEGGFKTLTTLADMSPTCYLFGREVPFGIDLLFRTTNGITFGIEICEDLWVPNPPSTSMALRGAEVIFNLSASPDSVGKAPYLRQMLASHSARLMAGYVYASAGLGESSTDLVFGGSAYIYENGVQLASARRFARTEQVIIADIDLAILRAERLRTNSFSSEYPTRILTVPYREDAAHYEINRQYPMRPFLPNDPTERKNRLAEIFTMQSHALAQRLTAIHCQKVVIGISGGLDSTLALLVCANTMDLLSLPRENILSIQMPGEATTDRTHGNAHKMSEMLGCTIMCVPIAKVVDQHLSDIQHDKSVHNTAYENAQARERTQILFDVANDRNAIVVGTGDLSELALGWCTYGGDHLSNYSVNSGVPKTLVRHLVNYLSEDIFTGEVARVLQDVLDTPISPELIPGKGNEISQKTEDIIGPYDIHDFFLYYFLRYGFRPKRLYAMACRTFTDYNPKDIHRWLKEFFRRFVQQQFKRSALPDGPKIGSVTLSPRGDWRMPSDFDGTEFFNEIDAIQVREHRED